MSREQSIPAGADEQPQGPAGAMPRQGPAPKAEAGPAVPPPAPGAGPAVPPPPAHRQRVTRAGVVWAAVVAALALLILLIIFILQNQDQVAVRYLGLEGSVPLGMALFIASVTGGVLVAIAGGARILQLRSNAHRARLKQPRP